MGWETSKPHPSKKPKQRSILGPTHTDIQYRKGGKVDHKTVAPALSPKEIAAAPQLPAPP